MKRLNKTSGPLKLELQMAVNNHAHAGNTAWIQSLFEYISDIPEDINKIQKKC